MHSLEQEVTCLLFIVYFPALTNVIVIVIVIVYSGRLARFAARGAGSWIVIVAQEVASSCKSAIGFHARAGESSLSLKPLSLILKQTKLSARIGVKCKVVGRCCQCCR